jgi:tryptophan synthase alpha chain
MSNPAFSRIDKCFQRLRKQGQKAFVAYIAAGDPDMERSKQCFLALERAGVDVIELGLPFSDPLADGIVNQMAAERALNAGATTAKVLQMVQELRVISEIPVVMFTYLNPLYAYGYEKFMADAAAVGVDGVLILDLPPDEAILNQEFRVEQTQLQRIQLVAPTSSEERITLISQEAAGFIYYVSRLGVTGAQSEIATDIEAQVKKIQSVTKVPVCVGFGVSNPSQAAAVAAQGDGVVVGSAIVKLIEKERDHPDLVIKLESFVRPMVEAVKNI